MTRDLLRTVAGSVAIQLAMAGQSWKEILAIRVRRTGDITLTFRRMSGIHSAARVPR